MAILTESCGTLQGSQDYYVVELYVDEIGECLVMRCSTIEGAAIVCEMLSDALPDLSFDITDSQPKIHVRDYNPEKYERIKELILGRQEETKPRFIVIDGGKK